MRLDVGIDDSATATQADTTDSTDTTTAQPQSRKSTPAPITSSTTPVIHSMVTLCRVKRAPTDACPIPAATTRSQPKIAANVHAPRRNQDETAWPRTRARSSPHAQLLWPLPT